MLKSIKSKIVVFAIMATLIPSLGLGLLSFRQNEAQISDNVTLELRALTSYASREIELWIDKRVHEVLRRFLVQCGDRRIIGNLPPGAGHIRQRSAQHWHIICGRCRKSSRQYWN